MGSMLWSSTWRERRIHGMSNPRILRFGEFFVGAGGLGLGFMLAQHPRFRFNPVFSIDNDTRALATYQANLKWLNEQHSGLLPVLPEIIDADVSRISSLGLLRNNHIRVGELDLLLGGPPCQGFSSSNRSASKRAKSEQNRLATVYLEHVRTMRPKMFLLENVQGVRWTNTWSTVSVGSNTRRTLRPVETHLVDLASNIGYSVWSDVLDAVDFGVPQHRLRFVMFGVRKDLLDGEQIGPTFSKCIDMRKSTDPVSVWEAIRDLPRIGNGQHWEGTYRQCALSRYAKEMRSLNGRGAVHDHFATNHAEYVIDRFRQIRPGQNWEAVRGSMQNYRAVDNTHSNIYRRLIGSRPAHTISHYRKSMTIHPRQSRGLSFREACRLQSFPDWFRFVGGVDEMQQHLANAVPPLMATAIARAIADFVSGRPDIV